MYIFCRFLFEGDPDFSALPTYGVIPSFGCLAEIVSGKIPGLSVDLANASTISFFRLLKFLGPLNP